ncbi:HlyD family efflux transporter periplasmic adaptor subunit [Tsuneonella sp. SYSU-LHT278]|uniref:HlyD family efflux transporter periplasmic adaptor subunit n=1 Tax=Tsuneonella sediminis TaxID=3416089 RepID=UPI003F7A1ADE
MADRDPQIEVDEATGLAEAVEGATRTTSRPWKRLALMAGVPLVVIATAGGYWLSLQGKVTTDNAYVRQDKVSITAEVGGQIAEVMVDDEDEVRAGDLMFRIDPAPYRIRIAQADAAIAAAQAGATALASAPALSGADIAAAAEDMAFAQANLERQEALWQKGFTTKTDYEAARHQVAQAREEMRGAQARKAEAAARLSSGAQVPGELPAIAAARAQRRAAELDLSRTEVRAPIAGRVTQAERLQKGQQVVSGLPVATIVATGTSYIEANFKETQLARMALGQPAEITFDAYPEVRLKGHVSAIGAGTGSEFSILPAQNATGNWVKVTQRVPVKIVLDERSPRPLIAGLSTQVTVFTDGRKR